jgi:hypothetical protein
MIVSTMKEKKENAIVIVEPRARSLLKPEII